MRIIALLLLTLNSVFITAQEEDKTTALLVIDIQDFYFPGGDVPLYKPEEAAANALILIERFRDSGMPVVFIKHKYEPGGNINKSVIPRKTERVISKSEVSSFNGTGLDKYLKSLGTKELVICGMQTHMCVEAATRAAYDLGYKCTLVEDACATRDLAYNGKNVKAEDVHISTLATLKSYANIIRTQDLVNKMNSTAKTKLKR